MTAARSLPDPVSPWSLAAAANDAGSALGASCGGFWETAVGDDRLVLDARLAVAPPCLGLMGATEHGAQSFARLVARWPDGSAYAGDLWLDILEYRELRMRSLSALQLGEGPDARLSALEHRLHARGNTGARRFTRFTCRRPARLTGLLNRSSGASLEPIDALLVDVSAGGGKLDWRDGAQRPAALVEGTEVELHVEDAGGPLSMVLPSRVVWLRGNSFGIMFAGAPRKAR